MIYVSLNEENLVVGFYTVSRHGQKKCDSVIENGGITILPQIWDTIYRWHKVKFIGILGLEEYSLFDFEEIKEIIEEVEIPKSPTEILEEKVEQLTRENEELKKMDSDIVNLAWDMDYRVCELEWTLEEVFQPQQPMMLSINNNNASRTMMKGSVYTMALSRFEQAKIVILSGEYDRSRMEMQLSNYLKRNYITQSEHDTLISMMDANDLITQ